MTQKQKTPQNQFSVQQKSSSSYALVSEHNKSQNTRNEYNKAGWYAISKGRKPQAQQGDSNSKRMSKYEPFPAPETDKLRRQLAACTCGEQKCERTLLEKGQQGGCMRTQAPQGHQRTEHTHGYAAWHLMHSHTRQDTHMDIQKGQEFCSVTQARV